MLDMECGGGVQGWTWSSRGVGVGLEVEWQQHGMVDSCSHPLAHTGGSTGLDAEWGSSMGTDVKYRVPCGHIWSGSSSGLDIEWVGVQG